MTTVMQATSHVRTHATQTHKADSGSVHIKKYHSFLARN
jgi:hypothetical protein